MSLPYEKLDEFEKLRRNPPFPIDAHDEVDDDTENFISREKSFAPSDKSLISLFNLDKNRNKMDENIKKTSDFENSKFLAPNLLDG